MTIYRRHSREFWAGGFDEGVASGLSTRAAAQAEREIMFEGRAFCFTGKFLFGPRQRCEEAVMRLGATPIPRVTKQLDYLVIGGLASRDWAHTSHGRKIEKAIDLREKGHQVILLEERDWAVHIDA
ncbi:BRCT domain-containing protein [Sediminicurvatus halobius]|uniref:BRCT domain-containing protein n=1 Tax=Sediminicurvatus halobius TaxID=2182432 RepID=UPI0011B2283F|nr:BRCT domain-containing protein [Spiribacter halobius]UEX77634.1 BRCT domain-containing protein [Spiribacter halobius]